MIVFENKTWQTNTSSPDTNYLEGLDCQQPKWIVPDSSEIARKIMSAPYWDAVEDGDGNLIDIVVTEAPVTVEEQIAALKTQLVEIDSKAIRPLRAIAAGAATDEDIEMLTNLEDQAEKLRSQIAEMEDTN